MGCFQTRDADEAGWCGSAPTKMKQSGASISDATTEEGKCGQRPSEVLRLGADLTNGLLKTYQKACALRGNVEFSRQIRRS